MNFTFNGFQMGGPMFPDGFQFGSYTVTSFDEIERMYELDKQVWVAEEWIVHWLDTPHIEPH